ncbi:hypothetical protein [Altericista sp. CCNU0014]|uniref:hypothetical protein n=1 Tax=Altericista sp. CCNU0014 TaxID=3082949 RepID=UPI00384EE905
MVTQNLRAIAASVGLTGMVALSFLTPVRAGEVRLTCTARQGHSTTIALNGGESIPFGSWSVSDAIDVAYAVKNNCQDRTASPVKPTPSSKFRVEVNSTPALKKVEVPQKISPAAEPITANVNSPAPQSDILW